MFNLIVGTGALTMPRAFAGAGWVVSLSLISFLGFMRYIKWMLFWVRLPITMETQTLTS